jgi:hypothetical protein
VLAAVEKVVAHRAHERNDMCHVTRERLTPDGFESEAPPIIGYDLLLGIGFDEGFCGAGELVVALVCLDEAGLGRFCATARNVTTKKISLFERELKPRKAIKEAEYQLAKLGVQVRLGHLSLLLHSNAERQLRPSQCVVERD